MPVLIHAILLISLPAATMASLLFLKRRNPTSRQFVVALALTAAAMIAAAAISRHMCMEGNPRRQILILGPCLLVALCVINSVAHRLAVAAVLLTGMIGLSWHFSQVVHTNGWTGNPRFAGVHQLVFADLQKRAVSIADDDPHAGTEHSAGWLADLPLDPGLKC